MNIGRYHLFILTGILKSRKYGYKKGFVISSVWRFSGNLVVTFDDGREREREGERQTDRQKEWKASICELSV